MLGFIIFVGLGAIIGIFGKSKSVPLTWEGLKKQPVGILIGWIGLAIAAYLVNFWGIAAMLVLLAISYGEEHKKKKQEATPPAE